MALRARYASMVSSASLTSKVRTLPPARTRTVRSWTRNGTPRPTAPGRPTRRHAPAVPAAPGSATTTEPPRSRCTSAACPSTMAGRPTTHSAISMRRSSTSRACNRAFCWRRGRWRASRPNGGARRRCRWWAPASQWALGGELAAARDVSLYYQPLGTFATMATERISSTTGLLTAGWQDGGSRAQINVIDGTVDGNGNSLGVWVDASHAQGAMTQTFGAFRIDPNLAWGNQLITSDAQGGYYRVDYQSRRWLADFGVDQVSSVSGTGSSTTFVNGDARYQLSRDSGLGGVLNVRRSASASAWSVEAYLDNANSYGIGRGQLDYATDPQARDATITLQQTWNMRAGTRLSTTAAVDHIRSAAITNIEQDSTVVRLAVYGGGDLTARLALDGGVQWATAVQGQAAPSRSADVSLTWRVARAWSVLASYYENRVGSWTPLVVTSPLAPPTAAAVIAAAGERGVFLTVRYQVARGAHFVPLGGVPGSGSGRLSGVVYLDANENGRYDAGEPGAANVTVILDGRFSVRSDPNGRFDFPAVAAGHHVRTVQTDNLPLPWTLTNSGRTAVDVATRDRTEINIGALRMK